MQKLQNVINLLQQHNLNIDLYYEIDYYSLSIIIVCLVWFYTFYKLLPKIIQFCKKQKENAQSIGFKLIGKRIGFK